MTAPDPTGTDWTDREIDLIVGDYFEMLGMDLSGEPYVKARRNAALQQLTGRTHGAIEFKHQNISAVLLRLGLPWIAGYKPMANFQRALIDGIDRYLSIVGGSIVPLTRADAAGLGEPPTLFFEPPPRLDIEPSGPPILSRLIRKFDPAVRDARNRKLGTQGEEVVLAAERSRLTQAGREDLARKIRWTSQEDGDGAGFDIASFTEAGEERLLEVKTTAGHQTTPFYLSENERAFSAERPDAFRLVRVYDFARVPRAFELVPPLADSVVLRPAQYRASFDS